jgi:hypothetical protein
MGPAFDSKSYGFVTGGASLLLTIGVNDSRVYFHNTFMLYSADFESQLKRNQQDGAGGLCARLAARKTGRPEIPP